MPFTSSVDIANRALQHCGAKRITAFTDDSKGASEVSFVYDKLRQFELRRNIWRFSVRRAVLRAISATTKTLAVTAWASGTTYALGQLASYQGLLWQSLAAANLANTPSDASTSWSLYFGPSTFEAYDSAEVYYAGDVVYVTTTAYLSVVSNNSSVPGADANWLALLGTLSAFTPLYPIGAGPSNDRTTRNIFVLPVGFLREAPQDPKAGSVSFLGAPTGRMYQDWEFENNYIVTRDPQPIIFRFAADVVNVPLMDPMFCEGLAAAMGMQVCEELTQSTEKLKAIAAAYKMAMSDARTVNGIEEGPTEPPEDDWITSRI